MKVVAVGDLSFKDDELEDTEETFENIKNQNPDLVIALGDLTYKKDANDFRNALINIGISDEKIKPVVGNHDDDEKLSNGNAENFWKLLKTKYLDPFNISNNDKRYYNFIKDNVYFLVLYTHPDYITDDDQLNFAEQKLKEASTNPDILWIIVCYHKPSVTSDTDGGHGAEEGFADKYHQLFDQYAVDLVLTGHNHNYQRSKLVKNNPDHPTTPIVVEDPDDIYDTRKGRIFLIVGTGGRDKNLENFEGPQEEYIKFTYPKRRNEDSTQVSHGILSMEFETDKKMSCKFITNEGHNIDSFIINKS